MKKLEVILLLVLLINLIVIVALVLKLKFLNTEENVNIYETQNQIYNDNNIYNNQDEKTVTYDILLADSKYDNLINGKEITKYKDISTEYIVEDGYKEVFDVTSVKVDIVNRSTSENVVVSVLPFTDMLGNYNMVKIDDNYSVFSYFSSGKGEEIYRCYLKNSKVVYIKDIEENKVYSVADYTKLNSQTVKNIEDCYKYYTDYISNK